MMDQPGRLLSLKSTVFHSQFEGGIVFRGGKSPVIFRGKQAYEFVQLLLRSMGAGRSMNDLLSRLPVQTHQATTQLLEELAMQGCLRQRDQDDLGLEHTLPGHLTELWNYLTDNHVQPGRCMSAWQKTIFYIEGTRHGAACAVKALLQCGASQFALAKDLRPTLAEQIGSVGKGIGTESARFELIELPREHQGASEQVIRIFAGDTKEAGRPVHCTTRAWYFGLLAGHLALAYVSDLSFLLQHWQTVMRRSRASEDGGEISGTRLAYAASIMSFAIFNTHANITQEVDWSRSLFLVDPSWKLVRVPAPDALTIRQARPEDATSMTARQNTPEALLNRIESSALLFDPIVGFLEDQDLDLVQVPLSVVSLRIYSCDRQRAIGTVTGWGLSSNEARVRAIERGIRQHLLSHLSGSRNLSALAVGWTESQSAADALALSAANMQDASVSMRDMQFWEITDPNAGRLLKILQFLADSLDLSCWTSQNPPAARVQVKSQSQTIGDAVKPDLQAAAYEALGNACLQMQLESSIVTEAGTANSFKQRSNELQEQTLETVDLGFPPLRDLLFCTLASVEER